MFDVIVLESLHAARRTVEKRMRANGTDSYRREDLDRQIADLAADLALERSPRLLDRLGGRDRLVNIMLGSLAAGDLGD